MTNLSQHGVPGPCRNLLHDMSSAWRQGAAITWPAWRGGTMPSYADVHDCILPVRHAGTKNFNGMLVYLGRHWKKSLRYWKKSSLLKSLFTIEKSIFIIEKSSLLKKIFAIEKKILRYWKVSSLLKSSLLKSLRYWEKSSLLKNFTF